jgi:Flp pilus assembly protein TadB
VIQRFLKQDEKSRTTAGSLRHLVQTICLGNSREIEKATEIRALEHPWKPAEFVATGLIVASASAIASTIIMLRSVTGVWLVIFTFAVFFATYRIWLRRFVQQAKAKQQRVLQLLPHAVDTITMVMQSGGTFLAGIESVIRDFPTHPLSLELQRMRNRLNRGQTMREAIELTARSIRLPEFDDVARILSRIHQHGASSTDSFARLSKQMRLAHLRRMEEQVGQAESKMSLPTMLILFSCMLVCLGPFLLAVSEIKFFD